MRIVVDANESRSELVELLQASWGDVEVRRLPVGDVAIGQRVLAERKTTQDLLASLADGRLFRQAGRLAFDVERPVVIQEGDPQQLAQPKTPVGY
jgi:DNA excision repair protein ERCC-4